MREGGEVLDLRERGAAIMAWRMVEGTAAAGGPAARRGGERKGGATAAVAWEREG